MSETAVYREFIARYYSDPVGFCSNVLKLEPLKWQAELLTAVAKGERRISCAAGHGCGKSTVVGVLMLWALLTRWPIKCVVTAPTSAQLYDALAAECKRWVKELPDALQELLTIKSERIELTSSPTEAFIAFRVSRIDQPEALQGIHSDTVILCADEASGVPDSVFEAAYGSMSGSNAHVILLSNPLRSSGYFFDSWHKSKNSWLNMRVSCLDSPLVSREFIQEIEERYGRDSNQYLCRVEGRFPNADDDTVIPRKMVLDAVARTVQPIRGMPTVWGLDVARLGADASVLVQRTGKVVNLSGIYSWRKLDLMALADRVEALYHEAKVADKPLEIFVDEVGLGGGCLDRLRQLGLPAYGVNVGEKSRTDIYANLRAELWFLLKDWLQNDASIPDHQQLIDDLTAPRFEYKMNGLLGLERKEQTAKRLGSSPDYADALMMTMYSRTIDPRGHYRAPREARKRNAGMIC